MLRMFGVHLGYFHPELLAVIRDAVVVEVGAHDGSNTVKAAAMSNVKRVYSFEASPGKIDKLRGVVAPYGDRVVFQHAAVTNVTGTAWFNTPHGSAGSEQDSLASQEYHLRKGEQVHVPTVRLDDVIHEHIDYLITDTQGNEFHVLKGATKLIDEYGIDIIQLEFIPKMAAANGENLSDMLHFLHDKGYTCFNSQYTDHNRQQNVVGVDLSFDNYPYLFDSGNGPNFQGLWEDLLCLKVR